MLRLNPVGADINWFAVRFIVKFSMVLPWMMNIYFVKLPYKISFLKLDCFEIKFQKIFLIFCYSKTQLLTLVSSPLKSEEYKAFNCYDKWSWTRPRKFVEWKGIQKMGEHPPKPDLLKCLNLGKIQKPSCYGQLEVRSSL